MRLHSLKYKDMGTTDYWQERVRVLSRRVIDRRMRAEKAPRWDCEKAFFRWVSEHTGTLITGFNNMTITECKAAVALLHRLKK